MMPLPTIAPPTTLARQVDELLIALAGELEARNHPHRLARHALGVNRYGSTEAVYNEKAFAAWSDLLRRNPDDFKARHHLAIMHHARAFDLEAGPTPAEADTDWVVALDHWAQLWQCDAFWNDLAARAWGIGQPHNITEVRDLWPLELLRVHYDIAFDPATPHFRAVRHIHLVQNSQFSEAARKEVRDLAYARFVSTVDSAVWQSDVLSLDLLEEGLKRIEQFLRIDPECEAAAIDALRLLIRVLSAWCQQLGALTREDPERDRIFRFVQQMAGQWNPFVEQVRHVVHKSDPDVRNKLRQWYRHLGHVHQNLEKYAEAVRFLEQAVQLATEKEQQRELAIDIVEARALEAREYAAGCDKEDKAWGKRLCDQLVRECRDDLSIAACFFLANAYEVLPDFDAAEALCRDGLAMEPDVEQLEQYQNYQIRLRELEQRISENRRSARVNSLVEEATALMKEGNLEQALQKLDRALQIDPQDGLSLCRRCQCHLDMLQPDLAIGDLHNFRSIAETVKDPQRQQMLEAADDLDQSCQALSKKIEFLGVAGLRLVQAAEKEMGLHNFASAEDYFRQAIAGASDAGRQELNVELAVVLNARAVKEVDGVNERTFVSQDDRIRAYTQAADWLEEATRLSPDNAQMTENLRVVRRNLDQLTTA